VEMLISITQHQQNVEGDGQAEPESELLGCDGQTREEEIKSHDQDESTATENETGTGVDGVRCRRNASRRPDTKVFGEGGFEDRLWALQRNFYRESEWGSARVWTD
jgi:hypothetical protein